MNNQNKAQKQMIVGIKDTFFEIPPYQRLYEWGKDEIETLLDDMKKAWKPDDCQSDKSNEDSQKSSKQYFIGNITTSIDKDDSNKFILIDGQQRLTTLWFIGFYLASKKCGEWDNFIAQDDKLRINMPIRDKERDALESLAKKIQKHNKEEKLEISKDLQGIHKKIIDAFGCIESWFNENFSKDDNKKEIDSKRLNCFANFIYTKICFVFVELAPKTDLNRFFVRMNNRGKQLEKHEILKARILGVIQQGGGDWQKYAKIWDLCSDMNKYIFQSASDRNIFEKENKDKETPDKVESIVDFPAFLLHCYKLWVVKQCNENEIPKEITITKDRLLEIMWDNQANKGKNKEVILDGNFIFNIKNDTNRQAKENCKEFIIDMLYYRVLFDYFVIKSDVVAKGGDSYKIMRLNESKDNYSLPENSKKGSLQSGVLHDLVMIQNYLRVSRQGDRQNYHHWLTPFLKFLDNQICLEMDLSLMKNCEFDFANFKCGAKKIAKQFSKDECDERQKVLVRFLENLDTNLAIAQFKDSELLDETNEAIRQAQRLQPKTLENPTWDFLNNGTRTPHYWFYRLEYYLWKNGVENEENLKIKDKNFSVIRKNFYFRNLGSVEHFQPQSEPDKKWWLNDKSEMDTFGNLALISRSLNSLLGKQNLDKKEIDIAKEGNSESLKLVLMCCLKNLKNNDNAENKKISKAQEHQEQMTDILIKSLKSSLKK
ncbi:GmrSD restriction endonuclease domain-containing protein [Helicobacter macacae]|uniref:DUF262 domain-containing protein n=1 Tax=Helicobacter macacae MIT 99-5501 TaxID=1357400 RepID=V8CCS4_9HELI|nr:DUF262 domain-containing protein [Helicobacter macacae]ETD25223.1 hypothetical protein HMPREF2086_00558 [Helicobacter macacae MIT 99-5501]